MAFASGSGSGPMADINVTPLVDVMLVLLIIFMVTAPILSYPIEVNLPQRVINPPPQTQTPPPPIKLRIDAAGTIFWNDSPVPLAALQQQMNAEVAKDPSNQPLLELDVNPDADYGILAKVLARAKNADMKKIGFLQQ
ncbi:ExbD/TolR family protein [Agrilutibacter solisilvae]|uniref:Biopolymer transporter ExbD n=1 Tax=Agrilutibacter solisilvae TaxID=2763317 RepID=A0A975ATI9_9GAMM|nr:biopolymer transporter ExbD [Lysobacter solisilvae]QSX79164.1 biopolymer transporter ExbD [Lysobacter solisilvae]